MPPETWQALPRGEWVAEQISGHLAEWWPRLYGHHLLKLGALSAELPSFGSPIKHQFAALPEHRKSDCTAAGEGIIARPDALPFAERSIDLVLAAHCLEFSPYPQQVLRECARVVAPYGHLLIAGFNPFSIVGAGRWIPGIRTHQPWLGNFIPPRRVMDWLQLLGFEVLADERMIFSRLGGGEPRHFGQWCETLGCNYWPQLGGIYLLVARKQVLPMTPNRRVAVLRHRLDPVGAGATRSALCQPAEPFQATGACRLLAEQQIKPQPD